MKNAIIFHGTDDKPDYYWYKWLGKELEKDGYKVEIPYNPTTNKEPIALLLPKVLKQSKFDKDTLLIGHSAGGPLVLSILENIESPIQKAIFVAGYCTHPDDQMEDPILQETYNWKKIRQNANEFIFINSINDPWSCDDRQGRMMFDQLGGIQVILNEGGHFGSMGKNQIYDTFPLLRTLALGNTQKL